MKKLILSTVICCAAFCIAAIIFFFANKSIETSARIILQSKPITPTIHFASIQLPALPQIPTVSRGSVLSSIPFGPYALREVKQKKPSQPRIVIIIDDMGMDIVHSREVLNLPTPLTLSFLPYAPRVSAMAAEGKKQGDELMIHMPMQPINPAFDLGSIALREGMADQEFDAMLDRAFASFDGYVGMNNHMGSQLTQDRQAMAHLMRILKARNLLFVDSRTIASSVAADEAAKAGVSFASRDVFLDDDAEQAAVARNLEEVEKVARRTGLAIAIGHPKEGTIAALRIWLPTLKQKGFILVPISAAVKPAITRQPVPQP